MRIIKINSKFSQTAPGGNRSKQHSKTNEYVTLRIANNPNAIKPNNPNPINPYPNKPMSLLTAQVS